MKRKVREPIEKTFDAVVGMLIVKARESKSVGMKELADLVKLRRQTLYLYETGITRCPLYVLTQIADVLGVNVLSLIPVSTGKIPALKASCIHEKTV